MRLGLIVPGGVDASGEYRVIPALLALIARLARRHEVRVFALRQEERPGMWELLGARIQNIGMPYTRMRAVRAICAAHRDAPFDVLHAFWSASPGLIAVAAARVLGIPSVLHVAGGELVALPAIAYGGRLTVRGRLREALVLRAASQVTAASNPMLAALAALGIAARRVPLGVDLDLWPPHAPVRRQPGAPARLIHVASLNRVKDQPTLLRALAALGAAGTPFEMDIVGEDTLGGAMQRLAQQLGLGAAVRFRGFLPQRELRSLMEVSDLMLHASWHEAGPVVLREAAVAGVPTVGTAVGEIADWAPRAARAVPVGDAAVLACEAASLLSDEELRLRIAQAAFALAVREDADYTASAFEEIYRELTHAH